MVFVPPNSPQVLIENHLSLVADWIAKLDRTPESVRRIKVDFNTVRDYDREKVENSHWMLWKYEDKITVTLVFADYEVETRSFDKNEWNSQFKA